MTDTASSLRLPDACALATAWLSRVGNQQEIRLLIIKGESLRHYGLRARRISADVDVLVDPRHFDRFCECLEVAGWRKRAQTEVGAVWSAHSLTYLNPTWPCDIDVHRYFPGFLADPTVTFELLWQGRAQMQIAHRQVPIPSRVASILIAGLHQLRDGEIRSNEAELLDLTGAALSDADRRDLVTLAVATESVESTRELVGRLGISRDDLPPVRDSPALREWQARASAKANGAYFWLLLLERTPPKARLGVLGRALWPSRATLLINHPDAHDTLIGRAKLRLARIPAGIRGLPAAAVAAARRRGNASDVAHQ